MNSGKIWQTIKQKMESNVVVACVLEHVAEKCFAVTGHILSITWHWLDRSGVPCNCLHSHLLFDRWNEYVPVVPGDYLVTCACFLFSQIATHLLVGVILF